MAALLGFRDEQLKLEWLAAGEGMGFAQRVREFVEDLTRAE